jgi:hypothetical protein
MCCAGWVNHQGRIGFYIGERSRVWNVSDDLLNSTLASFKGLCWIPLIVAD